MVIVGYIAIMVYLVENMLFLSNVEVVRGLVNSGQMVLAVD